MAAVDEAPMDLSLCELTVAVAAGTVTPLQSVRAALARSARAPSLRQCQCLPGPPWTPQPHARYHPPAHLPHCAAHPLRCAAAIRIERLNPAVNAFVHICASRALAEAEAQLPAMQPATLVKGARSPPRPQRGQDDKARP